VNGAERAQVADELRRIDDLVTGLGHLSDPQARETARELVERILDLFGLGLARIMTIVASAAERRVLIGRLAQDEQVKTLLLLYGLHPDDPPTRVQRALAELEPRLAAAGVEVELKAATASSVRLVIRGAAANPERLRSEIEEAIVDAAPDLDEVALDWHEAGHVVVAAPAG
jgi:hypothetical protein